MTNSAPNPRLANLLANYAQQRDGDESDTDWWAQVVGAWFLCGIIRLRPEANNAVAILNQSSDIVWC